MMRKCLHGTLLSLLSLPVFADIQIVASPADFVVTHDAWTAATMDSAGAFAFINVKNVRGANNQMGLRHPSDTEDRRPDEQNQHKQWAVAPMDGSDQVQYYAEVSAGNDFTMQDEFIVPTADASNNGSTPTTVTFTHDGTRQTDVDLTSHLTGIPQAVVLRATTGVDGTSLVKKWAALHVDASAGTATAFYSDIAGNQWAVVAVADVGGNPSIDLMAEDTNVIVQVLGQIDQGVVLETSPTLVTGLSTAAWTEAADTLNAAALVGLYLFVGDESNLYELGIRPGDSSLAIDGGQTRMKALAAVAPDSGGDVDIYVENTALEVYRLGYFEAVAAGLNPGVIRRRR